MKNLALILFFILVFSQIMAESSQAQFIGENRWRAGVKAGPNMFMHSGDGAFISDDLRLFFERDNEVQIFFSGGAFLAFRPKTWFSVQLEALYLESEYCYKSDESNYSSYHYFLSLNVKYLEFPILFKFTYPNSRWRPNIFFGPTFALRISSNYGYSIKISRL